MKARAITDFFSAAEGAGKRKRPAAAAAAEDAGPSKKAAKPTEAGVASSSADAASPSAPVAPIFAAREPGASSAAPPQQLGEAQLAAICERNVGAARVRCEQAAARGAQPALQDLLLEPSWQQRLGPEFAKPYAAGLQRFVQQEWASQRVFPPQHLVFRAFNGVPFDQVRVVILGQDPYHNEGQAMGMSFSVPRGQAVPSSLSNIYKELASDLGCFRPKHGDLTKWSYQGVLLLNAALTVRAREANSHAKAGWQHLTNAAIRALSAERKGLVFLLWGRNAQAAAPLVAAGRHHVLKAAHPSGLSAHKGFFGCRHFSKANALLQKEGLPPIDWQIE